MQFESTRLYRVKAIAEALDVSPATIYRAVESGKLDAYKIGTGKGAIRVPGSAIPAYLEACANGVTDGPQTAAAAQAEAEADGRACVVCGVDFVRSGVSQVPVSHSESGSQTFACVGGCEKRAGEVR